MEIKAPFGKWLSIYEAALYVWKKQGFCAKYGGGAVW